MGHLSVRWDVYANVYISGHAPSVNGSVVQPLQASSQVPPLPEAMAGVGPGETGLNSPAVDSRIYRAPSRT